VVAAATAQASATVEEEENSDDQDDSNSEGEVGGVDDDDELDFNEDALEDEMNDQTKARVQHPTPVPPPGWYLQTSLNSSVLPRPSVLLKRRVMWFVPVRLDGTSGWIVSEIAGGAPDPRQAALGVTMQLKSNKNLDSNTPKWLLKELFNNKFNPQNYGEEWFLLNKTQ
jgi:hypothetical protein